MKWYIAFLAVFISLKAVSSDCYDEEAVLKINCSLNAECLNRKSVGEIYNLLHVTQGFYRAGLNYNTIKDNIDNLFRIFKKDFSMINAVENMSYRCDEWGEFNLLIFGVGKEGRDIVINHTFMDGGIISGGRFDEGDKEFLSRYLKKYSWTAIYE